MPEIAAAGRALSRFDARPWAAQLASGADYARLTRLAVDTVAAIAFGDGS